MQKNSKKWGRAPDLDGFAAIAQNALDCFPEPFKSLADRVSIRVSDFADDDTLRSMSIEDPYELTGLYTGLALPSDAVSAPSMHPAIVWLYRLPILNEWAERGDVGLETLVAHVLIHELGHHFGWSDDEMAAVLASEN